MASKARAYPPGVDQKLQEKAQLPKCSLDAIADTCLLDKRIIHTNRQADHLLAIQAKCGRRVEIETFTEEALFTISGLDPHVSEAEAITEFDLWGPLSTSRPPPAPRLVARSA